MFKKLAYISFIFLHALNNMAQNKNLISIKNVESLSFDKEKGNAKLLRGNVICEHDGALLYCDTAWVYDQTNQMKATGHVMIARSNGVRITGDKLFYDGKIKQAIITNNVKCVDKDMVLTTNLLTYDVGRSIADYFDGGQIVDKENTLLSKKGHYNSVSKEASFHTDVTLTNPKYKMKSDTLLYNTMNRTAYFLGPSIIISQDDYIYCENGWYDTGKEKAQFSKNAILVTKSQKMTGDSLIYDRIAKTGRAFKNVKVIDTTQKSIIYGDYLEYKEKNSEALVTKKAIYARIMDKDTLFLAADTLYHRSIDSVDNFLNAYHHVRLYKTDIQAICDSASLNTKDSLIQLFGTPMLWTHRSQSTSKIIKVEIGKNKIKGFKLDEKAFLINQVDSLNNERFHQLVGKTIAGWIEADTLKRVFVNGNAEIIYFPKNKKKTVAMNKTNCSEIRMWFKHGDIDRVSFRPKTFGNIEPMKTLDLQNAKLKGFNWQYDKRPKSRLDLHPKR